MHWISHYSDGTTLHQFEGDKENRYEDIDRSRLSSFAVMEGEKAIVTCHIPSDGRLIYRQRVEKVAGQPEFRVWLVGCQTTKSGVNSQYVLAIFPDGSIEAVDGFREGTPWFYAPTIREGESWDI